MLHANQPSASISASTSNARTAYPANANQNGVRVYNAGSVPVFVKSGGSSVAATTSDQFVAPGATVIFARDPNDTYLAAITASSTATVYFEPCSPVE